MILPQEIDKEKDALFMSLFCIDLYVFLYEIIFSKTKSNIFCPAYRLKKCPPPAAVENAEMIYEDEDFQIGNNPDKWLTYDTEDTCWL